MRIDMSALSSELGTPVAPALTGNSLMFRLSGRRRVVEVGCSEFVDGRVGVNMPARRAARSARRAFEPEGVLVRRATVSAAGQPRPSPRPPEPGPVGWW